MTIKSIYKDYYRGMTFKVGVAYLRIRSESDRRAPAWAGSESLNKQRKMIARAAKKDKTIIVAEFIDDDRYAHLSPFEGELGMFCRFAGVQRFYIVNRSFLGKDPESWEWAFERSKTTGIAIREVDM